MPANVGKEAAREVPNANFPSTSIGAISQPAQPPVAPVKKPIGGVLLFSGYSEISTSCIQIGYQVSRRGPLSILKINL